MILYLLWFFTAVIICFYALPLNKKEQTTLATYYLVALGLFIGLADMLGGYDRYIYGELFDAMADVTNEGGNPWLSYSFVFYKSEFGYGTFSALMSFITSNRYLFIFTLTIIIYILLIISLKEYSSNMPFSVILFLGLWAFFTFTYLRQVIGCTIGWLSIQYIIKRDFKMFLLIWFIGYSFHNSLLILLPMYFIPIRKFQSKTIIYIMIAAFILGLTSIPNALFETYGEADANRMNVEGYAVDSGFRIAYLIEASFFLFIILTNYKKTPNRAKDVVLLNMALIFCAILLVFIRSENGGRLGWVYMIGIICTITSLSVNRRIITRDGYLMIFILLLLYIRIYISWQTTHRLYPYKTFLTDGYRENDPIRTKYEYDNNYDQDKLYRPAFWFLK